MILILLSVLILAVGLVAGYFNDWDFEELAYGAPTLFGAFFCTFCLLFFVLNPIFFDSWVVERDGLVQTVEVARTSGISEFELAAIQQSIAESNKELASAKFWANHPLTNWFWPKKVQDIEPIK